MIARLKLHSALKRVIVAQQDIECAVSSANMVNSWPASWQRIERLIDDLAEAKIEAIEAEIAFRAEVCT